MSKLDFSVFPFAFFALARRAAAFALLLVLALPAWAENRALLIGVSAYDNPKIRPLNGPRNDVILLWRTLQQRGFRSANIAVLAEGLPDRPEVPRAAHRPTRAAILAALERLADEAKAGDFILVHFSGHGTTQPERDPDNNPEPEPGGRDQVLLPQDAGSYDPAKKGITNGLVDDEIGAAFDKIREKGATLWAIIDACHAGTVTRSGAVVTRSVDPADLGVPAATPRAMPAAAPERVGLVKNRPQKGPLIGFFAVDSWTEAIERDFSSADDGLVGPPGQRKFGVFTWHLLRALQSGRAQSYRDLARLITLDLATSSAMTHAPQPVFDGALDHALFGQAATGPRRFSAKIEGETLLIEAGALNGFDAGAEIALHDGPLADAKRIGRVRLSEADVQTSRAKLAAPLSAPSLWASIDAPAIAFHYRIGLAQIVPSARYRYRDLITRVAGASGEAMALEVREDAEADLDLIEDGHRLWLVPQGQALVKDQTAYDRSLFIALDQAPEVVDSALRKALWAYARAANLVRLAGLGDMAGQTATDLDIRLERMRETAPDKLADPKRTCADLAVPSPATALESGLPAAFGHCDQLRLSIFNRSERDYDIGVFYIDPRGGISVPVRDWRQNGCVGFLPAKAQSPLALRTILRSHTANGPSHTGLYRVVVFALPRNERMPPNLCHLLQASAEAARAEAIATRNAATAKGFAALLQRVALLDPGLRNVNPFEADEATKAVVRLFSLDLRAPQAGAK